MHLILNFTFRRKRDKVYYQHPNYTKNFYVCVDVRVYTYICMKKKRFVFPKYDMYYKRLEGLKVELFGHLVLRERSIDIK